MRKLVNLFKEDVQNPDLDTFIEEDLVDLVKSSTIINDLPDSAFAYVEDGGAKDESGKTTPRTLRHFPVHDKAHAQNALSRLSQSPFGEKAKSKVLTAAHQFGIKLDPSKWIKKETTVKTSMEVVIKSFSAPQRLFYGIVYEPGVEDTHGDFTTADEIEKAAHDFLPNAVMNIHHKTDLDIEKVQVVESYIAPNDFKVGDETIRKGSWVLVSRVLDDELAGLIEKGEITGYSLEGTAVRIEY